MKSSSFQNLIFNLQKYWADYGCAILQPIDTEVGAGTLHSATVLRVLGNQPWNISYLQQCRRPADARYGQNPNRLGSYYQFQTLLKPAPSNIKDLFIKSIDHIGIDIKANDIRFIKDDWENPSVGAFGFGWEFWINGMEMAQFTYMQKIGGIECEVVAGELTYGLERIAMHLQDKDNIFDLVWNDNKTNKLTYGDIFLESEQQNSFYIFEHSNIDELFSDFRKFQKQSQELNAKQLPIPAYEQALKASHTLNLLDARGVISATERASYISQVRDLVKQSCELFIKI